MNRERIYLRELHSTDWQGVHEYASLTEVCQYQPWGPNSMLETKAYVEEAIRDQKKIPRTRFVFAVIKEETEELIGAGEFNKHDSVNCEGEIGYVLHPREWRKGIGTEIAHQLLDFGFHEQGCHRIVATCDPRNVGSFRVLEKVGMMKEGLLRDHILLRGGWRDSLLYSLLEYEWK